MMENYTYLEGSLTPLSDIIKHANEEKENLRMLKPLSFCTLGYIFKELWGDKVKKVRRGMTQQRHSCLLNLVRVRNNKSASVGTNDLQEMVDNVHLPNGWTMVSDGNTRKSFV